MRTRVLLVEGGEPDAEARAVLGEAFGRPLLVARLEAGTAGVVSEYSAEAEVIRIGHPAESRHAFLRAADPKPGTETCASVALGRTVFGRGVRDVVCADPGMGRVVAHALAGHDVRVWTGTEARRPEEAAGADGGRPDPAAVARAIAKARESAP